MVKLSGKIEPPRCKCEIIASLKPSLGPVLKLRSLQDNPVSSHFEFKMGSYWSSPFIVLEQKLRTDPYSKERHGNPTAWLLLVYQDSPLVPEIKKNLEAGNAGTPTFGLALTGAEAERAKFCLQPLANYLARLQTKHSTFTNNQTNAACWLNLDTGHVIQNCQRVTQINIKLRVVSRIMKEPFFQLIVAYLTAGDVAGTGAARVGVTVSMRELVWQQSGGVCFACLKPMDQNDKWEAGHILSVKHGGSTTLTNLKLLCFDCNHGMGSKHLFEFMVAHQLPGVINLSSEQRQLWQAVVALTELAIKLDATIQHLPLAERLVKLGKVLTPLQQ